ncbi:hypothetical protein [Claveliimonas bilis]|uniref:Uncharacterized protein n=1 Tax=Claveliimonas bilis TaxID=3028070 RepID=A0ABM8I2U2_9FIRM|nr:hypothetical protein [Claveliimonas bilis]BDZ76308.1 hypothetical protein Lac1_04910 [Claveliimonas bilis]BDZ79748.1 hypothetical protein Lac3_09570 [Claveliimonas bilis]
MYKVKGGGSRIADNFEGRHLTADMEPMYYETLEYYVYNKESSESYERTAAGSNNKRHRLPN